MFVLKLFVGNIGKGDLKLIELSPLLALVDI